MFRAIFAALLTALFLTACGSTSAGPEKAVETYFNAINEKDSTRLSTISCADYEAQAQMEMDAFQAVTTTLEGLSCKQTGTDGDVTLIECQGKIVASYNGEPQDFDLSGTVYRVKKSGDEWLVCGVQ
jgi:hypothetical protein